MFNAYETKRDFVTWKERLTGGLQLTDLSVKPHSFFMLCLESFSRLPTFSLKIMISSLKHIRSKKIIIVHIFTIFRKNLYKLISLMNKTCHTKKSYQSSDNENRSLKSNMKLVL